ncbi:MAG: hypothetical protein OXM55_06265 [Bdellovibrionales bacterium]|nr:hypothetical protein [Bdellovibrionales bacterium]
MYQVFQSSFLPFFSKQNLFLPYIFSFPILNLSDFFSREILGDLPKISWPLKNHYSSLLYSNPDPPTHTHHHHPHPQPTPPPSLTTSTNIVEGRWSGMGSGESPLFLGI